MVRCEKKGNERIQLRERAGLLPALLIDDANLGIGGRGHRRCPSIGDNGSGGGVFLNDAGSAGSAGSSRAGAGRDSSSSGLLGVAYWTRDVFGVGSDACTVDLCKGQEGKKGGNSQQRAREKTKRRL
jgi:hypothetical protein